MVGLQSLPEEILTQMYILAGEETDALSRLPCVDRRLRDIWLKDSDHIIASVIRLIAPEHADAVGLTLLEKRLPKQISGFYSFDPSESGPPLRLCLSDLWCNISLAAQVCKGFAEWNVSASGHGPKFFTLKSTHPAYYLVRQMVVAYQLPQVRPSIGDKFMTFVETGRALETYAAMSNFMATDMAPYLKEAHNVEEPCSHTDPGKGLRDVTREWAFACNVGWKLILDRQDDLPDDAFSGYYPNGGPKEESCTHCLE